jgi:lipid-A-disaccharide synthase
MRLFISAGEPSGDLHAANLIHNLRTLQPNLACAGFGGERMKAAGCDLLFPLAQHAIMGLTGIISQVPTMWRLLRRASDWIEVNKPDAVVLVDYPGFHWWLAKRAKKLGVPVVSFVAPQIWSWATHRVRKVRACFDHVLCTLPFEEGWYHERGVPAQYIGHPYFDELSTRPLDDAFITQQRGRPGRVVAMLPGSRQGEVDRNLETLIGAARRVHAARPDARYLFACFEEKHRQQVLKRLNSERLPAEAFVGRTAEIIHIADVCAAVSGSVGLELLYHTTPSVVVYRLKAVSIRFLRLILRVPYIGIVNLLAGRELFPEFLTSDEPSERVAARLIRWLENPSEAASLRGELAALRDRVGQPGACRRAAEIIAGLSRPPRIMAA